MHRLVFILIVCCCLKGVAQAPSSFLFTHYSTKDGLASNEINRVQQDRDGFIWLATSNGLQRYDGTRFRTFQHRDGDSASLPSNIIHRLFIDRNDVLWGATSKGEFFVFDKYRFTCRPISVLAKQPARLLSNETMFIPDLDGHLFLLIMGSELLAYDEKKSVFSGEANFIPLPPNRGITGMVQQPGTKKYWLGLQDGGIAIYNRQTGHVNYAGHNPDGEPAIAVWGSHLSLVYPLFDTNGRLWGMTWGGGFPYCLQYDPQRRDTPLKKFEFISRLKMYHELNGIFLQRNGRVWVKGANIFAYFDEKANDFVLIRNSGNEEKGIKYEGLSMLLEDREGNLWAGTSNNGLYRFNPDKQYFTNVLHEKRGSNGERGAGAVMSFIELNDRTLLAGAWEDALFRYSPTLEQLPLPAHLPPAFKTAYAWSMCASADSNTVWMGAQPSLWQYNQQKQTVQFYNPPQLQNRTVRQVAEDKSGALWLGMHNFGLFRYRPPTSAKKDSIVRLPEVGNAVVTKILVDRKGLVWAGTGGKGVFVYDATTLALRHHFDGGINGTPALPGYAVTGLLDYNDSLVFIADDSRLYSYNRNTNTVRLRKITGTLSGTVAALEKDADGNIWISTTNALYRVHPMHSAAMVFDRRDGILNDQFVPSASYRLRDGRLLFGTNNSFIVFDPRQAGALTAPPVIHLTALQIGQRELPIDSVLKLKRLELSAKASAITIEFSTLEYNAMYPVQYKMEGIDTGWRFADAGNKITYPVLPPAPYRLLLRAYSPDGTAAAVTELAILVRPPWYQSWWFYTLAALAFVIELWWLDRQRTRRKESMQKVRTDIAANLHEEINTALNNINILSEIARLKSDREPQKAKEYLEQIHTKSHNMIIALDDMLWSLNPANDAMDKTISRIREFADALMQRHGTTIELLIDKRVEKLELNMKLRHEAFQLFKEGLRSLVGAGTRHCVVHLTADRGKLLFTIEFANEGCNMQQLNNLLHRRDMELRLDALKAKLDVQVHKSRSVFLLQLPLA